MKKERSIINSVFGGLVLALASSLPTTVFAAYIFDFEFRNQPNVEGPVVGTFKFSTANSDDAGNVILDYTGSIHGYTASDWVTDSPAATWH